MVEMLIQRRRFSKTYSDVGSGRRRQVVSNEPMHYQDVSEDWQEYDFVWTEDNGTWVNEGGPWTIRVDPNNYLLTYINLAGEEFTIQLLEMGGVPVPKPPVPTTFERQRLAFIDAATDLDILFRLTADGVSINRRLKSASAPRTFLWQVEGRLDSKETELRLESFGLDNLTKQISRERYDERRRLQITSVESGHTPLPDGRTRFNLFETWTGNVSRTNPDHSKEWTVDAAYPVYMDPTFGPASISAVADDGEEYVTGSQWYPNRAAMHVGQFAAGGEFQAGLRWQSITATQGCTIQAAQMKLNITSFVGGGAVSAWFKADLQTNAPAFTTSDRPSTGMSGTGTTARNFATTQTGVQTITGLTAAVQAVVNQTGWTTSNAMRFAAGRQTTAGGYHLMKTPGLTQHSTPATPAKLTITWTTAGGPSIPIARHHYSKNIRSG